MTSEVTLEHAASPDAVQAARSGRRLHSLTGLRFAAALLVFLQHAANNLELPDDLQQAAVQVPVLTHGTTGVGLFFALSGFVIVLSYGRGFAEGRADRRQFLLRRVARLWPAYLVATTLFIPIGLAKDQPLRYLALMYTGLQSWVPTDGAWQTWNALEWSVSTEAFFYVLFAVVGLRLMRLGRSPGRIVLLWASCWAVLVAVHLVCLVVLDQYFVDFTTYRFPVTRSLEFLMGAAVALLFQQRQGRPLPWRLDLLSAVALVTLVLTTLGPEWRPWHYAVLLVPLFGGTVYWLASSASPVARLLGTRPLQHLGDWSYAFYLLHAMVYLVVGYALRGSGLLTTLPGIAAVVVFCFVVSTALSAAMHLLVERPAQRALLRRWDVDRSPAPDS